MSRIVKLPKIEGFQTLRFAARILMRMDTPYRTWLNLASVVLPTWRGPPTKTIRFASVVSG